MSSNPTPNLHLQLMADMVCPWCFIGKRSLDLALPILAEQGIHVAIEWLPFQLNPNLPAAGMDRKAFRSSRFGSWANAVAMDERAIAAGRPVGARFNYDRQPRTPSTLAAHALARLALVEGGADLQGRIVEALLSGYFTDGEDIGDLDVLQRIASSAGMSSDAVGRSRMLQAEVVQLDEAARATSVTGVPAYRVDGKLVLSGAQSVDGYVEAFVAAARQ